MARGWSGAVAQAGGGILVGAVAVPDRRTRNLRELLVDLSRSHLCIVLGAGASHGVVPMSPREVTEIAWKMLQAKGSVHVLSSEEHALFARYPEVQFLTQVLQSMPTGSWDRFVLDALSPGHAALILNDVFSPQTLVPKGLVRIYDALENRKGVVISYNYDGIDERQSRFPVIAPHGRRPRLLSHPVYGPSARKSAREFLHAVPTDWHLPIPENDLVRRRPAYQEMLTAWARSRAVVFVGYGFGGGADAVSFEDFGRILNPQARVHVLCPRPDNADLCRQIGHVLRGRGPRFRVFGQPFRWRPFADAVLEILDSLRANSVREAIGKEFEIVLAHDRG